jgi:hypothetical protein
VPLGAGAATLEEAAREARTVEQLLRHGPARPSRTHQLRVILPSPSSSLLEERRWLAVTTHPS